MAGLVTLFVAGEEWKRRIESFEISDAVELVFGAVRIVLVGLTANKFHHV